MHVIEKALERNGIKGRERIKRRRWYIEKRRMVGRIVCWNIGRQGARERKDQSIVKGRERERIGAVIHGWW